MKSKNLNCNTLVIRFVLISIFSLALYLQSAAQNDSLRHHYSQRSKSQRTGAWILLGAGVTTAVIGGMVATAKYATDPIITIAGGETNNKKPGKGAVIAGAVLVAGSIPLFIGAAHDKRKAKLTVFNSTMQRLQTNGIARITQPCILLSVPL